MATKAYAFKHTGDEYYTLMRDIEECLSQFDLSNYKVYCPCDSDKSNFVKYLKDKCKELKYTWDDFRTHDDLFEWADIIITNPPFSLFADFLRKIWEHKKDYVVIGPITLGEYIIPKINNKEIYVETYHHMCFLTPSGEIKEMNSGWYSSLPLRCYKHKDWIPKTEPNEWYYKDDGTKIAYFKWQNVPTEWDGEFLVPITWVSHYYERNIEFIKSGVVNKEDGSKIFRKFLVRIKK